MNNLTNLPRNAIGDRAGPEWLRLAADAYLDHRHRNWVLSEEMGDVRFVPEAALLLAVAMLVRGGRMIFDGDACPRG
jgi:hypothetical protein